MRHVINLSIIGFKKLIWPSKPRYKSFVCKYLSVNNIILPEIWCNIKMPVTEYFSTVQHFRTILTYIPPPGLLLGCLFLFWYYGTWLDYEFVPILFDAFYGKYAADSIESMNEWINKWKNEWRASERINELTNEWMNERMNERANKRTNERTNARTHARTNEWTHVSERENTWHWMNQWTNENNKIYYQ